MKKLIAAVLACTLAAGVFGCGSAEKLDPNNPVKIMAWTYYNGAQQEAFEALVDQFNSGEGLAKGIVVEHISQGGVNELVDELLAAADSDAGAQALPNLAMVYPETAYGLKDKNLVTELDGYFDEKTLAAYVPAFLEEGRLTKDGPIYIIPVAKSTEIFALNKTDWDLFASATGADAASLSTMEGVTETSEAYYDWTDSLTPEIEGDGKAFFGRDAIDNYMVIGSAQLGSELFPKDGNKEAVAVDKAAMRTLWDNYYVPLVKGHFSAEGKFASDDMKMGKVISYVGSTSSMSFFPQKVTRSDDSTYDIEAMVLPAPVFTEAAIDYRVQQGAGFCVLKGTEQQAYASAEFLKWFTAEEQNLRFSVGAAYLPVTISANNEEKLASAFHEGDSLSRMALTVGAEQIRQGNLYISKPFTGMEQARRIMKGSLLDLAKNDRNAVVQAVAAGTDIQTAQKPYLSDARFEEWYEDFSAEFTAALG